MLVFQSGANAILHAIGLANQPFGYTPTKPFGVPAVWSAAFWGGVWGLVFGLAEKYFPRGPMYYVCAFLFGAIAPVLVLWFIVFPLKGQPDRGRMERAAHGDPDAGPWLLRPRGRHPGAGFRDARAKRQRSKACP